MGLFLPVHELVEDRQFGLRPFAMKKVAATHLIHVPNGARRRRCVTMGVSRSLREIPVLVPD